MRLNKLPPHAAILDKGVTDANAVSGIDVGTIS